MPKIYNRCSASEFGFTLVELLIALAISSIFLAGVIQIFSTSSTSYSLQEDMAAMQQNIRVGKMFIERDVRMAGSGFGNVLYDPGYAAANSVPYPIYPVDYINSDPAVNAPPGSSTPYGSDTLTISYINTDNLCSGTLLQLTPTVVSDSTISSVTSALYGSISVASGNMTVSSDTISWSSSLNCCLNAIYTHPFSVNSTGLQSDVFTVSSITSGNLIYSNLRSGITLDTSSPGWINPFSTSQLVTVTYKWDYTQNSDGSYSYHIDRYLNGNLIGPIAENIEDIQFAFGLDTGSGSVDTWINDGLNPAYQSATYTGVATKLSATQQSQIRLVRINILGRTAHQHPGQTSTRPAIENHTAATVADHYSRQLLTTTVEVRNMR